MKKRDFVAALCLLECDRKYAHNTKIKTLLGIAYCAFHNGDYAKSMQIYDELIKRGEQDQQIYVYKACCLYATG
jgi:intraflagellar transport protein 56